MAEQPITNMRIGPTNEFSEIRSAVIGDREALANIKAILFPGVFGRICLLLVEPALDSPTNAIKGQFRKLVFHSGIVGKKDLPLPFPDAHLSGWNARTCRSTCAQEH